MKALIIQKGLKIKKPNPVLALVSSFAIYSMIIPVFILDLWTRIYQNIYFTTFNIPKIKRDDYLNLDRTSLSKLTFLQKLNCFYCEYVNGVVAWVKKVANQTEIYSCAIKHRSPKEGENHQNNFYEFSKFE